MITFYHSFYLKGFKVCFEDFELECLDQIYSNMSSSEVLRKECIRSCPTECETNIFSNDAILTYSFPQSAEIARLFIRSILSNPNIAFDRRDSIATILLKFTVYYDKLGYISITESPASPLGDLVSKLGGTLGLFLGFIFLLYS